MLSGDEEARLAFDGALRGVDPTPEPVLVIDIGGGSTELILGDARDRAAGDVLDGHRVGPPARALPRRRPATPEQIASCVAAIDAALDACPVDPASAAAVIGIAGTVTTVAAGVLGLPAYDRDLIHGQVLEIEAVHRTVDDLVRATREERLALGYVHPGRADVIDAGALIMSRVLRRATVPTVTVAETDILDGIAWSLVG